MTYGIIWNTTKGGLVKIVPQFALELFLSVMTKHSKRYFCDMAKIILKWTRSNKTTVMQVWSGARYPDIAYFSSPQIFISATPCMVTALLASIKASWKFVAPSQNIITIISSILFVYQYRFAPRALFSKSLWIYLVKYPLLNLSYFQTAPLAPQRFEGFLEKP